MSEHQQKHKERVSLEEYNDSKIWRSSASELAEPLHRTPDEEDQSRGQFTMRLLEKDESHAFDQRVEVVGADTLSPEGLAGPLAVTLRTILPGSEKRGRLETHSVAADGIIINNNADTPNLEGGYFVGGEGTGQEKLEEDFDMVLRVPNEEPALKAMELPLQ